MNASGKIEFETTVNMTSKGQVLIPKEIRDRMGLKPNGPVRVGINRNGETVVLAAEREETREERMARVRAAIEAARGAFKNPEGMSTDEYMRWLRGDWEP
jgi:antitoxin PrlF